MKWVEIHQKYPNKFILLGDIIEEKISNSKYRILEGTVLKISDDPREIRKEYNECRKQGKNVLYSLPSTSNEFIVENVPFMGIL